MPRRKDTIRDMKDNRSKDVPWRVKCRKMVEHVYSVFSSGSENWSRSQKPSTGSKDGKQRLASPFQKNEDESDLRDQRTWATKQRLAGKKET